MTAPERIVPSPEAIRSGTVVDTHHPNPAIRSLIDSTFDIVRIMPPDAFSIRLSDGTVWVAFVHRANGLP